MRRNLTGEGDTTQPAAPQQAAPRPAAPQPAQAQPNAEEMNGLDIPTFLRRQSN
ncbi:hypothetical protein ACFQU7_10250 [Pseudoroseomonas wenyumeiae]